VAKIHTTNSFFPLPALNMPRSAPRSEKPGYTYNVTMQQIFKNMWTVTRQNMPQIYAESGHEKGTKNI